MRFGFALLTLTSLASSLGSRSVRWLGKASKCHLKIPCIALSSLSLCQISRGHVYVFVQVVSPSLGWPSLLSFLVVMPQSSGMWCPSVLFDASHVPCQGPLYFLSHIADYIYGICPFSARPKYWSFCPCMWCCAYLFPFLVCMASYLSYAWLVVWVTRSLHHISCYSWTRVSSGRW